MLNRVDHVTIPGHAITRMDVDYDHKYELMSSYASYPQRYITGATSANYTIEASAMNIVYDPPITTRAIERATVKRRIYLFTDPSTKKTRAIILGFREMDSSKIEEWADENYNSVSLDIEPGEVDVRWLAPPKGD